MAYLNITKYTERRETRQDNYNHQLTNEITHKKMPSEWVSWERVEEYDGQIDSKRK